MTWERHETTWYVVIMVCFSVFFGFARKLWIYPSFNFLTSLRFFGDNFYLRSRKAPWACTKTLVFKNRTIWHENGTKSLVMWRKWYFFQFFFGFAYKLWIYPSCNFPTSLRFVHDIQSENVFWQLMWSKFAFVNFILDGIGEITRIADPGGHFGFSLANTKWCFVFRCFAYIFADFIHPITPQ